MESILNSVTSALDESINRFKQFDGRDFNNFINTEQKTSDFIREGLKEISEKHDSHILKMKIIFEKCSELNQLSIQIIDRIEESDDMRELNTFSNGVITLTSKEKKAIKTITLVKKSEFMKPILQMIEDISKFQNLLKIMVSEIEENNELIEDSLNEIGNIRQHFNETMENQNRIKENELREKKLREELRKNDLRENELREMELEENELREKELREELRKKDIREEELREKELRDNEKKINDSTNQENWNKFKYPLVSQDFPDSTQITIIHAFRGTLVSKDDISVKVCQSDEIYSCLKRDNEILSRIVRIKPFNLNSSFNPKVPWRISIPYAIITDMRKEVSVLFKDKITEESYELDTLDAPYEEGRVESVRFAESVLPSPNCYCVVISKRKAEKFILNKDGMKYESKGDEKIVVKIPQDTIKTNLPMQLLVQSIKLELLNEIKSKFSDSFGIRSISPIVELIAEMKQNLKKPLELQLPISNATANSSRKGRINSANPVAQKNTYNRSRTSYSRQISDEQNSTIKLASYNDDEKMWEVETDTKITLSENDDSVTTYITKLGKQKVVAIICSGDVADEKILKALKIIEQYSERRLVVFGIGQGYDDPHKLTFFIVSPNKIDKIKKLNDFNQETLSTSQELYVCERDRFIINLNGNIKPVEDSEIKLTYNAYLSNRVEFHVEVIDKYAQRHLESYQGHILVYKEEEMSTENILYKTSINLPKYEYKRDVTLNLDFKFKSTDAIDNEYLKFLSHKIGDCWKDLGHYLQLQDETIRRIANDPRVDVDSKPSVCLLSWVRNTTVQSNRVQQMIKALRSVGRDDLVNDLLVRSKKK